MSDRAERLLCCAVAYRDAESRSAPVPTDWPTAAAAVETMMRVLWHEAHEAMAEPIAAPDAAYLHPVDLDTDEPGIVVSKSGTEVRRRKPPFPPVDYIAPVRTARALPPTSLTDARAKARRECEVMVEETKARAKRDARADARAESARKRREARERETADEREARLAAAREKRAARQAAKAEAKNEMAGEEGDEDKTREEEEENAREDEGNEEEAGGRQEEEASGRQEEEASEEERTVGAVLDDEAGAERAADALLPVRSVSARLFATPIPFDRHLNGLARAAPHADLLASVLHGTPSSHLRLVDGPPGTGKTHHLVHTVLPTLRGRVLFCAPTNVAAANLYTRLLEVAPTAALLLPPSRTPPGTPVTSQDPAADIVVSTISGRAGPLLDAQEFESVVVDEAAQAMEAWCWCLLRPEVRALVLVGDVKQLPALTSESGRRLAHDRSLMERLIELKYPVESLTRQRRMHAAIAHFPNHAFYGGALVTETEVASDDEPYLVLDVADGACEAVGTSYRNMAEVRACVRLVAELRARMGRVVVICPYQAQARALLARGLDDVHTVDSFQGQEADGVVLSVVRDEHIGFWSDERRLNVALTRAKGAMRVVGSVHRWTGILGALRADAAARGLVRDAKKMRRSKATDDAARGEFRE